MLVAKSRLTAVSLTVAMIAVGCGGGGGLPEGVKTGTVKGTLKLNGQSPPDGCTISFMPEGGTGIPAGGSVSGDGSFQLRAKGTLEVPTGIYKVVVSPPPPPVMSDEEAMQASNAGTLPEYDPDIVPEAFRSVETSTEVREVKEGENNFDIDLK